MSSYISTYLILDKYVSYPHSIRYFTKPLTDKVLRKHLKKTHRQLGREETGTGQGGENKGNEHWRSTDLYLQNAERKRGRE